MSGDNQDLARNLTADSFPSIALGNKIYVGAIMAGGKPFIFTPDQASFLIQLDKLRNLSAAAISIGKTDDWADAFLSSRKFVQFRTRKLEDAKLKAGINTQMLLRYAQWNLAGKKEWWDATCAKCHYQEEWYEYEVESCRDDNFQLQPKCNLCFEPITLEKRELPFTMNREQMDHWKEVAARLWPKVERVHHEFIKADLVFETASE
jgi:hypothetical protein